jgi:hypothetical protein
MIKEFLSFSFCGFLYFSTQAQIPASSFSFSCVKTDTVSGCNQNCVTLTARIPNIKSSSGSYVVNRISEPQGCFRQYVSPAASCTLIPLNNDDSYSAIINLPFDFPFYGVFYNSLVVSANGYISFDVSNAQSFSHYGMLSSGAGLSTTGSAPGVDLPSDKYHKALIMAPYHDLNSFYTSSPERMMKYNVTGAAPHRRWILTYYKIPLYSAPCSTLFENTHQLVLHESTGIVEIFINSKQVCTGWNNGRAMIGMQDDTRTKGIMPTGRAASDPSWGSPGMNESWRFIPSDGSPLLKRVELYDAGGSMVRTGNSFDAGNGVYNVSFPNVCVDSSSSFIIKSTYEKYDNPQTEVYGTDTLQVVKYPAADQSVWTGVVSTAWEDPLNWLCSSLPNSNSNVIIAQGNVVVNSNITVNSISVQPGASLLVTQGFVFTVLSTAPGN